MRRGERVTMRGAVLGCLLFGMAVHAGEARQRTPRFSEIAVVPLTVEPETVSGAPERRDREEVLRRLGEEATARAERSLLRQQLATAVGRAASAARVEAVLSGTVRLPVSLPRRLRGSRATFQPGRFARATVVLRRPGGAVIAEAMAVLEWDEVRWSRGARQARRERDLDAVLTDAVRKVVDRAVKRLASPSRSAERPARSSLEVGPGQAALARPRAMW